MKKLMYDCFGILKDEYPDFKIIGREAIFSLDNERYVKLSFTREIEGRVVNSDYKGYKLDIINREKGLQDSITVAFKDIFESYSDLTHPNKIEKVISNKREGYGWYGIPTSEDLTALSDSVFDYLDFVKIRETPVKINIFEKAEKYQSLEEKINNVKGANTNNNKTLSKDIDKDERGI